jgi:NADPH-dependent curcumin reductase CurA
MTTTREVRLRSRPTGLPGPEHFEIVAVDLPDPGPGEVRVSNLWLSVDPYMRGRMNDAKSYVPPFQLGEAMTGGAVGEVVASRDPGLKAGDLVQSMLGWREGFTAPAASVRKLDLHGLPPQAFLGIAGVPGLTAYVGLLRIAALKPGDVVFVSAASGAVGSAACQIARLKGCRVIGSAGGADKTRFLTDDLKLDAAIDYKAVPNLAKALQAAAPDGIDVYFDNVGGEHLEAALTASRPFGRFALCGMISQYNDTKPTPGPRNLALAVGRSLRLEGYIVTNHFDMARAFLDDMAAWIAAGQIRWKETVVGGIEKAPDAFLALFSGGNFGKMLVKLD